MKLLPETSLERIASLTKSWGLGSWDVLIASDGSGLGHDTACGWASILIDRHARRRKLFDGGMNCGSSALAELLPFMQALTWYENEHAPLRREKLRKPILSVALVTDCKSLANQGELLVTDAKALSTVKANRPLWVAMLDFERYGYAFHYHWIDRCTAALNVYCDDKAGRSRKAIQALDAARAIAEVGPPIDAQGRAVSIYDVNPD